MTHTNNQASQDKRERLAFEAWKENNRLDWEKEKYYTSREDKKIEANQKLELQREKNYASENTKRIAIAAKTGKKVPLLPEASQCQYNTSDKSAGGFLKAMIVPVTIIFFGWCVALAVTGNEDVNTEQKMIERIENIKIK